MLEARHVEDEVFLEFKASFWGYRLAEGQEINNPACAMPHPLRGAGALGEVNGVRRRRPQEVKEDKLTNRHLISPRLNSRQG